MQHAMLFILMLTLLTTPVLADWKLTQKTKMVGDDETGRVTTIYQKGVRQRREDKIDMGAEADDPEVAAMMAQMGVNMPTLPIMVSQCDLKQDLFINEKNRAYFIDYYDWSTLPAEKLARRPNQKMVIRGTITTDTVVLDSGKRQQMFGLAARWLKVTQTIESSADSCDGASHVKLEQEGWFVTLSLESESCPIQRPPGDSSGGCRPKLIVKRAANPGIMITGTMRTYEGNKMSASLEIETLELSKATLDPALFDIPKDFVEVDSRAELDQKQRGPIDTSAKTVFKGENGAKAVKTIAIDYFSGNASKIDQEQLRNYIAGRINGAGLSGFVVSSQADIAGGRFPNVLGVEIKKAKESGASKVGGLFSKVTGTESSTLGSSTAEIVVTLYAGDGKTIVARSPASAETKGDVTDAVKAALDQVIDGILAKMK